MNGLPRLPHPSRNSARDKGEDSMKVFGLNLIADIIFASTQLVAQLSSHVALCRWRRRMLRAMRARSRQ
jgi:hypothetical protein